MRSHAFLLIRAGLRGCHRGCHRGRGCHLAAHLGCRERVRHEGRQPATKTCVLGSQISDPGRKVAPSVWPGPARPGPAAEPDLSFEFDDGRRGCSLRALPITPPPRPFSSFIISNFLQPFRCSSFFFFKFSLVYSMQTILFCHFTHLKLRNLKERTRQI